MKKKRATLAHSSKLFFFFFFDTRTEKGDFGKRGDRGQGKKRANNFCCCLLSLFERKKKTISKKKIEKLFSLALFSLSLSLSLFPVLRFSFSLK